MADPIDGTNNFLRGLPLWGISIAYTIAGEPVIGLIHLPCVGRLYSAVRAGGAWCDGRPIHASRVGDLAHATDCRRHLPTHVARLVGCRWSKWLCATAVRCAAETPSTGSRRWRLPVRCAPRDPLR